VLETEGSACGLYGVAHESKIGYAFNSLCTVPGLFCLNCFLLDENIFKFDIGMCGMFGGGIECGGERVVQEDLYDAGDRGKHIIVLEYNKRNGCCGTLHFFVDRKQILHTIVNAPSYVHFYVCL
jgi:hypothetical protein